MDTHLNPAFAAAAPTTTSAAVPSYRLFDPKSVLIAAILGSPVAGVALMAMNYRRLGEPKKGTATFFIGLVVTVLASVIGYFLPSTGSIAVGVSLAVATRGAAQYWQGAALAQHEARGGQLSSTLGRHWHWAGVLGGTLRNHCCRGARARRRTSRGDRHQGRNLFYRHGHEDPTRNRSAKP